MNRNKQRWFSVLLVFSLLLTAVTPALAQDTPPATPDGSSHLYLPSISNGLPPSGPLVSGGTPVEDSSESVDKAAVASAASSPADSFRSVSVIVVTDSSVNPEQLAAISGGEVIHTYSKVFNGLSMVLPQVNVDQVANTQGVQAVYLDKLEQPNTEVSPAFIGAPTIWNQLGGQESAGEDVIVGILDTGIWPEHPSFSDPDPSGKPYPEPPVQPGAGSSRSTCDFGSAPNDPAFTCNNKLIGAYTFLNTYKALVGLGASEFNSARDTEGHGTHTASTAAGNANVAASIFGIPRGNVSGIAPRAHIIAYRVCATAGCYQSDSVAAIDQAMRDGVNVLNFSIGGGSSPYGDAVELAFLDAYAGGVFVAASAGNSGPGLDTTEHRGPWVTTVAASTSNREFLSTVTLTADNGDTVQVKGASVTEGAGPLPVVMRPDSNKDCSGLAPGSLTGKIVVCDRIGARLQVGYNAYLAGAAGMILRNVTEAQGADRLTDNHYLPAAHVNLADGATLATFLANHTGVIATMTQGIATPGQGDRMASFSSRGGPAQTLGVSKPDITAPGVQILAGTTPLPSNITDGRPGQLFQAIQGTSMSSPHIAGAAAVLKDLHPEWTPGQIKSAIMSTAKSGVVKEDGVTLATPFDTGSGRVDLSKAGNPGLTFDESAADYVALRNQLWNANYPSLYVPVMPGRITVTRTVHNETNKKANWKVEVDAPNDVTVTAPKKLELDPGANLTFEITVDARMVPLGQTRHALLRFTTGGDDRAADGDKGKGNNERKSLVFPITIVRNQPAVPMTKTCDPAAINKDATTTCTITATNTSFSPSVVTITDRLPEGLKLIQNSVVNATAAGNKVTFNGALAGAQPPDVTVAGVDPTTTPAGRYLPLSAFQGTVVVNAGDETITNFNVPAFVFAGETYSRIGIVSDGYLVVGGGTGADIDYLNQHLPDAALPNNVLAPFWTDLNPAAGGTIRINVLTNGTNAWIVVDFDGVPNYSNATAKNQFEVWIGINGTQDISFVYGSAITNGDNGLLTVGAENKFGNRGQNYSYNGAGAAPSSSTAVRVSAVPGAPGETRVITFKAKGDKKGPWVNCAELTSDLFQGVNTACFSGQVNR